MDPRFILGIPAIDAQHTEIFALVESLQGVLADQDRWVLIAPTLKRLRHLLITHFDQEEAFMGTMASDLLPAHKAKHVVLRQLLETHFAHPPVATEYDHLGKLISDALIAHISENDAHLTDHLKHLLPSVSPKLAS